MARDGLWERWLKCTLLTCAYLLGDASLCPRVFCKRCGEREREREERGLETGFIVVPAPSWSTPTNVRLSTFFSSKATMNRLERACEPTWHTARHLIPYSSSILLKLCRECTPDAYRVLLWSSSRHGFIGGVVEGGGGASIGRNCRRYLKGVVRVNLRPSSPFFYIFRFEIALGTYCCSLSTFRWN